MSVRYAGPIVDGHHHLWDLSAGHYPWLQDEYDDGFFLGDYQRLRQDFLVPEYRAVVGDHDVVADVHVEAERSRSEQVAETDFLEALRERTGTPSVIVAHVGFTQPDRDDVLAAHAARPHVRGIRSKPVTAASPDGMREVEGAPGSMQDDRWLEGLARLSEHGLSWDLRVPAWHLEEAAEVVRGIPDTTVVLNHCGLPLDRSPSGLDRWRDGMAALAALPNVVAKVSELGLRGGVWDEASNRDVVRDVVRIFGWDRVLFASNMPVSSLAVTFEGLVGTIVDALEGATPDELDALFQRTARRVYRIDRAGRSA